ncbi:MAG: hypothetical protein WCS03_03430 [Bacteroidota bacterium]
MNKKNIITYLIKTVILIFIGYSWDSCSKFADESPTVKTDTLIIIETDTIIMRDTITVTDTGKIVKNRLSLLLKTGSFSVGDTINCALRTYIDSNILAAKFTIYYNKAFLTLVNVRNSNPANNSLFVYSSNEQITPAYINIQIGSPGFLKGDTLSMITFKTLNITARDSIYFARDFSLTTLRDEYNQPFRIEKFENAIYSIK